MTVAEWVRFNASRAAGNVRSEFGRMVDEFEEQGRRALRAVEGIEIYED